MKIQHYLPENTASGQSDNNDRAKSVKFKGLGMGIYNFLGSTQQGIQNSGYIASFLIQDGLGMTLPRVGRAYLRDREVTGEFNHHEGREVLLREGLTGPFMMSVAPIMLFLAAKFGKTNTINSQLIKRYGKTFKELISNPKFDKALLKDKTKLDDLYRRDNIEKILTNTLGKEHYGKEDVSYILEQIKKYENPPKNPDVKTRLPFNKKSKYRRLCIENIDERINNLRYKSSSELNLLEKVKMDEGKDAKNFATRDVIDGLIKFSDDVIKNNKHLENFDATATENFISTAIAKRFITTITTIAATLGGLSVIPKIYAKSDISPGARTAMKLKAAKQDNSDGSQSVSETKQNAPAFGKSDSINNDETENPKNSEASFKGKGGNSGKSILSKFGDFLRKHLGDKFSSHFEYDGINFTNTLMMCLSVFGLLLPRGFRAYNRAQVDETGKKDPTEIYEILLRDLTSSLSVIFAVPMLTRAFITSYENKKGFVLMDKDRSKKEFSQFLDLINPYSKTHVFTNKELKALYFGVDSKEKMLNFCKYIDKNNGDLQKIFAHSNDVSAVFNDQTLNLKDIEKLPKAEKNRKIIELFENSKLPKAELDSKIKKLMQGAEGLPKKSKLLALAKGLNSAPALLATFVISPILLGWIIPGITYANTRRIHEKREKGIEQTKKAQELS